MLHKETQDKLEVLGIDVSKLTEALTSENEVSLDVPELIQKEKYESDLNTVSTNRFEEGKKTMKEIHAKEVNESLGLGLGDGEKKNWDKIFEAYKNKVLEETGKVPDEKLKTLLQEKEDLQNQLQTQKSSYEEQISSVLTKMSEKETNDEILNHIPNDTIIPQKDVLNLFKGKYSVVTNEAGQQVVVDSSGNEVKDTLHNNIPLDDIVKDFAENYIKKDGMNGGDRKKSGSAGKFSNLQEFQEHCEKNNLEPMSPEAQKILLENKTEGFSFNN